MDLSPVDIAAFESIAPEGAIPLGMVEVAIWIDPDTGQQAWLEWVEGDLPVTNIIGILEMVKVRIMDRAADAQVD